MLSIKDIDVIILDFDGVITNNKVTIDENGNESVICSRSDGLAFNAIRKLNIPCYILSTETNNVVKERATKLKIPYYYGIAKKEDTLIKLIEKYKFSKKKVLYIGNDINDYNCMLLCNHTACPSDSHPSIIKLSKFKLKTAGGEGVVREVVEDLLKINIYDLLYK